MSKKEITIVDDSLTSEIIEEIWEEENELRASEKIEEDGN